MLTFSHFKRLASNSDVVIDFYITIMFKYRFVDLAVDVVGICIAW